jgi:hypothetical protein
VPRDPAASPTEVTVEATTTMTASTYAARWRSVALARAKSLVDVAARRSPRPVISEPQPPLEGVALRWRCRRRWTEVDDHLINMDEHLIG